VHLFVPDGTRNWLFWAIWSTIVLNVLLYLSGIITEALSCIPINALWEPWVTGQCIDKRALDITSAYFNLAVDIFILLLPQAVIWKLHMTQSRKIGVSIIFSFGLLTLACGAGRVHASHMLLYPGEGDTNYTVADLYMWVFTETSCALLVFRTSLLSLSTFAPNGSLTLFADVTGVPKAFSDGAIGSRLVASFRSWSVMSGSSSKDKSGRPSASMSAWTANKSGSGKPEVYQFTDLGSTSQVRLTDLEAAQAQHFSSSVNGRVMSPTGAHTRSAV
jgi:hypothetical protein